MRDAASHVAHCAARRSGVTRRGGGGIAGVDTQAGKNLVGAFHQPRAVFCDLSFLATLPLRHVCNGMAEVIKIAATSDAALFAECEAAAHRVMAGDTACLLPLITRAIALKANVVQSDEREAGMRAVLNWGHTVGHALETAAGGQMLHGECVAVGCVKEAQVARAMGVCSPAAVGRAVSCLRAYGLPTQIPGEVRTARLLELMRLDKKGAAGSTGGAAGSTGGAGGSVKVRSASARAHRTLMCFPTGSACCFAPSARWCHRRMRTWCPTRSCTASSPPSSSCSPPSRCLLPPRACAPSPVSCARPAPSRCPTACCCSPR